VVDRGGRESFGTYNSAVHVRTNPEVALRTALVRKSTSPFVGTGAGVAGFVAAEAFRAKVEPVLGARGRMRLSGGVVGKGLRKVRGPADERSPVENTGTSGAPVNRGPRT
jgi:hypothetical protein